MFISAGSAPDPFVFTERPTYEGYKKTNGRSPRAPIIDPSKKTLVLIVAGQSLATNTIPTLFVPTNASIIDNFSLYDSAIYNMSGPLIGCGLSPLGPGNLMSDVADRLIGTFDRVIVVPVAIGSTSVADWATGAESGRLPVAIRRLAARGITPSTPGVTMAQQWLIGEQDANIGTSQAAYQAAFGTVVSKAQAEGFSGRIFVNKETWAAGNVSATIQAAQTALIDNVTIFAGANLDARGATYRQADNTHPSDTGRPVMAADMVAAMHASGSPY